MNYTCHRCKKVMAKEDRRRKEARQLVAVGESTLLQRENEAPRIKCGNCGHVTILLKGSI